MEAPGMQACLSAQKAGAKIGCFQLLCNLCGNFFELSLKKIARRACARQHEGSQTPHMLTRLAFMQAQSKS